MVYARKANKRFLLKVKKNLTPVYEMLMKKQNLKIVTLYTTQLIEEVTFNPLGVMKLYSKVMFAI